MKTRMFCLAALTLITLFTQHSACFAADGDEFIGTWRESKPGQSPAPLTISKEGDYFVIDDGAQKINAVYGGGTLKVPGRMGIVLATYDKETAIMKYLRDKEYKIPGRSAAKPSPSEILHLQNAAGQPVKVIATTMTVVAPKAPAAPVKPVANGREVARQLLEELRLLDSAIDQWAIENNKTTGAIATADDIKAYLKVGSHLYKSLDDEKGPKDPLGNSYGPFTVDSIPRINPESFNALSDVADANFWSPYK